MRLDVLKADGGIVQKMYENGEEIMSTFSPRPYRLGQACDGTIDTCVHALFILWARAKGLDPQRLYEEAYPDKQKSYDLALQEKILNEAMAQGIEIPNQWGEEEFQGLIESLTEINNHSLVEVVLTSEPLGTTERFLPRSFMEDSSASLPSPQCTADISNRRRLRSIVDKALTELNDALKPGHSEALAAYLAGMARLRSYSLLNQLLITAQCPHATNVAGYREWQKRGRHVRKGERGILITAPIIRTRTPVQPEDSRENPDFEPADDSEVIVGFRSVYVFDISQTEGDSIPEPFQARGDPSAYLDRLKALIAARGITITAVPNLRPLGVSRGGMILIRDDLSLVEAFTTLAHELAHEVLHHRTPRAPKKVRETEAEAVAHVVSTAIGLDTTQATADDIHLYQGDTDTLYASLKAIRHTANTILDGLGTTTSAAPATSEPQAGRRSDERTLEGFPDLTTTVLEELRGRTATSKQFIADLLRSPDLKQVEREIGQEVLNEFGDTVPTKEFAEKMHAQLLPRKRPKNSPNSSPIATGGTSALSARR